MEVTVGGMVHSYNKKRTNLACDITCGAANNASAPDARWTTWSYHFLELPVNGSDKEFEEAVRRLYTENKNRMLKIIVDAEHMQVRDWEHHDWLCDNMLITCGNCALICWPDMEDRRENYRSPYSAQCSVGMYNPSW